MSLLTKRTPDPNPHAIAADPTPDPAEYVVGVVAKYGSGIVALTHAELMTRGEAMFELEKWQHSDTTRRFVLCRVTVVE